MSEFTYLNAEHMARKLDYSERYFKEVITKKFLEENIHYVRGFGGRKIMYIWERVEEELLSNLENEHSTIPMSSGGILNG